MPEVAAKLSTDENAPVPANVEMSPVVYTATVQSFSLSYFSLVYSVHSFILKKIIYYSKSDSLFQSKKAYKRKNILNTNKN